MTEDEYILVRNLSNAKTILHCGQEILPDDELIPEAELRELKILVSRWLDRLHAVAEVRMED